jgi:hypothetical protein
MPKNLVSLANALNKKANEISKAASDLAVRTALTIVGDLAIKTPVDTSKAISNWQVALQEPLSDTILPHYPGSDGSTFSESAAETLAKAKLVLRNKKPRIPIYITNNLPYIQKLNDGSSKQEPAGFVERAILIARKYLENRRGRFTK